MISREPAEAKPARSPIDQSADELVSDVDVHAGRVNINSGAAITPAVMVMFDDRGIRMIHTSGDARPVVADLIANTLGIGGLREPEPQRGGNDAKKYLSHWTFSNTPSCHQLPL